MFNPLEQFIIIPLYRFYNLYFDLSFSNSTLYMFLILSFFFFFSFNISKYLPNSYIYLFLISYRFVFDIVNLLLGFRHYFPFLLTLFFFILFNNSLGLLPFAFTSTALFIISLSISLSLIIGTTFLGLYTHNLSFFSLFVPRINNPLILPLIVFIEILSYLSRILSLSIRLTANLFSGHLLLYILSLSFSYLHPILSLLPSFYILGSLYLFEFAIAFIQSYVFLLLASTYIKDVLSLH